MRDHDLDLTDRDLAGLVGGGVEHGRQAVRTLLAQLGYGVERGRPTDAQAEGFPDRLAEAVRHLEVLAVDELNLSAVYLIELKSVTRNLINQLAGQFKRKAGDTLAILTADYQRLDFVLFDLVGGSAAGRQAQVIPRRVSLLADERDDHRRAVTRRAIRRFTWTEPDALAQWDKLRSAFAIAEWSERYFDNRGLFSDYYLAQRLPQRPEWQAVDRLREALRGLQVPMLEARHRFSGQPEAALRAELLEPLFRQLGFDPRQRKSPDSCDHATPDYELCDPASGERLAVCLTYHWDRFLDGPGTNPDDPTADENPGAAIVSQLEHDGGEWAVVTNGKHWRLYSSYAASQATDFFQIDLEEAAADSDPTALRYFLLMFRASAFARREVAVDGDTRSLTFLDELLEGSRDYARQVGDRLKERVFEDIFPILADGFIADLRAAGQPLDDAWLRGVFDATLTLLYRLLFLLYAESRDLLPVRDPGGYWERSLACLKTDVASAAGAVESQRDAALAEAYRPDRFELFERLRLLFGVIDLGEAGLNVPPYNGGLFATRPDTLTDPRERATAEFLNQHRLSDHHTARALDRLARDVDDKTHGLVAIDYKSLGVRQLGSIYEGLLEFRVQVARETMAVCDRNHDEVILSLAEARTARGVKIKRRGRGKDAPEWLIDVGEVYLTNSKLERKATGSYYTPEDIVTYIVEHTVGPVLETKLQALRDDLDRACADAHRRRKAGAPDELTDADGDLIARLFDCRVLDPAMGSGHFLVTAVDFLADRLIHFLNGFPHNPVERLLRRTRREIIEAVAADGVLIDEARLTDVNLLKRHVLKRCIFGVDLNPMAVELAKVSLWLHGFTLGAPLSFLGHHLKHGNSLVGELDAARVIAPGSNRWGQFQVVVGRYLAVSRRADATAAEAAASRDDYGAAEAILEADRRRANVETARHFEGWSAATVGHAQQIADGRDQPGYRAEYDRAQALAAEHGFFHWPLEFPEIWFEPKGQLSGAYRPRETPGFDAVVGNPPYLGVRTGVFADDVKAYYTCRYATSKGNWDLYSLFIERESGVTAPGGGIGVVTPVRLAANRDMLGARRLLYARGGPTEFLLCGRAFEDPTVEAAVTIQSGSGTGWIRLGNLPGRGRDYLRDLPLSLCALLPDSPIPLSIEADDEHRLRQMASAPARLGSIAEITRGMECGKNDPAVSRKQESGQVPVISGEGVRPYAVQHQGLFVRLGLSPVSRYKIPRLFLAVPKVLVRFVAKYPIAAVETEGVAFFNTVYSLRFVDNAAVEEYRLLAALLNSTPVRWWFAKAFLSDEEVFPHIQKYQLEAIPLPCRSALRVAALSLAAITVALEEAGADDGSAHSQIDAAIGSIYGLSDADVRGMARWLASLA